MNTKACGTCTNFDQIVLGNGARKSRFGWCAVKSSYPHKEAPGQIFPVGVKRVEDGELAKPVIVDSDVVIPACALYQAR